MRFGNCSECNEYKHLPSDGICRDCSEDSKDDSSGGDWELVFGVGGGPPRVIQENMTKEEAKKRAGEMRYVFARCGH